MRDVSARLERIVLEHGARLRVIAEERASRPRAPGKWSAKGVVGHLIDSASNNLQRLVRMQLQPHLELPGYDGDAWVRVSGYEERPWGDLVAVWEASNRNLVEVLRRADPNALRHTWRDPEGRTVDLETVARDYVAHLEHHLAQI